MKFKISIALWPCLIQFVLFTFKSFTEIIWNVIRVKAILVEGHLIIPYTRSWIICLNKTQIWWVLVSIQRWDSLPALGGQKCDQANDISKSAIEIVFKRIWDWYRLGTFIYKIVNTEILSENLVHLERVDFHNAQIKDIHTFGKWMTCKMSLWNNDLSLSPSLSSLM